MIILITFLPIEIKHISVTKVLLPFNWDVSGLRTGRIQIRSSEEFSKCPRSVGPRGGFPVS